MNPVRLLPFATTDGATAMASDEALLESAADRGLASLRFYTWSEPTLTLGYFQPHASREQWTALRSVPFVRRATGGAGILHHHELTYALALPAGRPSPQSWVCRIHDLVRAELAEAGVSARLATCDEEQKLGEVLCFLHHTAGDLVAAGAKVAGSAQRKLRNALLQHGSLLLNRSEFAPVLAGTNDLAGRELFSPRDLADRLARRFAAEVGVALEPGDWLTEERDRIPVIRAEKYANPTWNLKR